MANDPNTGLMHHAHEGDTFDFPKWVAVHASHMVGRVAPEFSATDWPRDGVPLVLVSDADEEAKAVNPKPEPAVEGEQA